MLTWKVKQVLRSSVCEMVVCLKHNKEKKILYWKTNTLTHMVIHTLFHLSSGTDSNFPSSPAVKNLPANAGDTGSIPGPGKIPHALGQLSMCALWICAPELWNHNDWAHALESMLCNKRSRCSEQPRRLQPEKAQCGNEDPAQPKTDNTF